MKNRIIGLVMSLGLVATGLLNVVPGAMDMAHADDWRCTGTIYGLKSVYNPATGSGFLAVRSGPTTSAKQIGELFNNNVVVVHQQQGKWVLIHFGPQATRGWVYSRYIRVSCR